MPTTRLRHPDCCVLLAAETARADVATFDDTLAEAATQVAGRALLTSERTRWVAGE